MKPRPIVATVAVIAQVLLLGACSGDDTSSANDAAAAGGSGSAEGGGALKWYATCGDPVCRVADDASTDDSGVAMCTADQSAGASCTMSGATCGDPERNCGSVLLCTDHDPKGVGSCPVSSRRFKEDINYVSSAELDALTEQLYKVRLATYRYKQGDQARHLGFILEDSPDIVASDLAHSRVDLYAYASMAVAALQVQARTIKQLEADVDALSNEVEALTGKHRGPAVSSSYLPKER